jgi:glutathione synthase/RimK-type ligase-like ATP-grasp enzyme
LYDLQRLGVPVVPTVWARRGERHTLAEIRHERGWHEVVLKPARGAASHDVAHVRADGDALSAGQARLDALLAAEDALIQPYLGSVASYGERALIFLGGRYSHTVVKKPFDRAFLVGDDPSMMVAATSDEVAVASAAVAAVPGKPLYARVDLLQDDDGRVCVSELELIEPGLYFAVHEPASAAFADLVERELDALKSTA